MCSLIVDIVLNGDGGIKQRGMSALFYCMFKYMMPSESIIYVSDGISF